MSSISLFAKRIIVFHVGKWTVTACLWCGGIEPNGSVVIFAAIFWLKVCFFCFGQLWNMKYESKLKSVEF
jgi:hypothetical protein